jgi:hypothetical protein
MGSKDRSFTAFRNGLSQNDSFPSIREQNIPGRVLPAIAAEFFIQPPHRMAECIEWSHGNMTAGNKPSHIDDVKGIDFSNMIDKKWIWKHFINHIRTFILCLDS